MTMAVANTQTATTCGGDGDDWSDLQRSPHFSHILYHTVLARQLSEDGLTVRESRPVSVKTAAERRLPVLVPSF